MAEVRRSPLHLLAPLRDEPRPIRDLPEEELDIGCGFPTVRFVSSSDTRVSMRHRRAASSDVPTGNRLKCNFPLART